MTDKSIARHTAGPWEVVRQFDYDGSSETTFVERIGPFHIEWHDDLDKGEPERIEADIALASAAPDLLEALQGVLRVADRQTIEFDAARAAIAKAEGVAQ